MRPYLAPHPDRPVTPTPAPTFSIVIPAWEAADWISRSVESALAQTAPAVEIVVSDDGSTDDLAGALAPYRDRVRLLRGPHAGPSAARNRGFRVTSSDFVANLDADDVAHPRWLEALGELAAARPDLDILTTDGYLVHDETLLRPIYSEGWIFYAEGQRLRILQRNFITGLAAVRRRRFLDVGGYDESLRSCEDWDFWLRLILDGSAAGCIDEPLVEYTVREHSSSTRLMDVLCGAIRLLEKAGASNALEPREREELARTIAQKRRELDRLEIQEALVGGDPEARRRALAAAVAPGHATLTRLKLVTSAVAPRVARRLLQRRYEREWMGAGGTRVKRG